MCENDILKETYKYIFEEIYLYTKIKNVTQAIRRTHVPNFQIY